MMKAKYSEYEKTGKLYVDCTECDRGINGTDVDKCSCGWRKKKGGSGGCFLGTLIHGIDKPDFNFNKD